MTTQSRPRPSQSIRAQRNDDGQRGNARSLLDRWPSFEEHRRLLRRLPNLWWYVPGGCLQDPSNRHRWLFKCPFCFEAECFEADDRTQRWRCRNCQENGDDATFGRLRREAKEEREELCRATPAKDPPETIAADDYRNLALWVLHYRYSWDFFDSTLPLRYQERRGWWCLGRSCWKLIEETKIRTEIREGLRQEWPPIRVVSKTGTAIRLSARLVSEVIDELKSICHLDGSVEPPAILHGGAFGEPAPDPKRLLLLRNGAFDVSTKRLHGYKASFLNANAADYDFDGYADCTTWKDVLKQWGFDRRERCLLQEWFGYVVTRPTERHVIFLLTGPTRSGKGLITHILSLLLGRQAVATPTLQSLSTRFGKEGLATKRLCVVTDSRISGKADHAMLAETLLTLSGGDCVDVERKYDNIDRAQKLDLALMIVSNEEPAFHEASGALANRFKVLRMTRSFLGKEDRTLLDRLCDELPGILNWALRGAKRLEWQGHFTKTKDNREAVRRLECLASPVKAFIEDQCVIGSEKEVGRDILFAAYVQWCESEGLRHTPTRETFGRDLRAIVQVEDVSPRRRGKQIRVYRGIGLSGRVSRDPCRQRRKEVGGRAQGRDAGDAGSSQSSRGRRRTGKRGDGKGDETR